MLTLEILAYKYFRRLYWIVIVTEPAGPEGLVKVYIPRVTG
jgi:hypothetical protein